MDKKLIIDPARTWKYGRGQTIDNSEVVSRFISLNSGTAVPEFRDYRQSIISNDNESNWLTWNLTDSTQPYNYHRTADLASHSPSGYPNNIHTADNTIHHHNNSSGYSVGPGRNNIHTADNIVYHNNNDGNNNNSSGYSVGPSGNNIRTVDNTVHHNNSNVSNNSNVGSSNSSSYSVGPSRNTGIGPGRKSSGYSNDYHKLDFITHDTNSMDYMLSRVQAHRSNINRRALDNSNRFTRNNIEPFVTRELIDNEKRIWWEDDLPIETDYTYFS